MNFISELNNVRRKLTKTSTKLLLKKYPLKKGNNNLVIKKVLVNRPDHRLGNQLLITPLIQEIENQFPGVEIYLFTKGKLSKVIFKYYNSTIKFYILPKNQFYKPIKYLSVWFKIIFSRFDLCINCETKSFSGRISTMLPISKYKINHEFDYNLWDFDKENVQHIAKKAIIDFRIYFNLPLNKSIPKLNLKLTSTEIDKGKVILETAKQNNSLKTICIYTNATKNKCFNETWWQCFMAEIELQKIEFEIIELLPIEYLSKVEFKYPTIYSTDIREMASVIENVDYFITGDCGVMHLASATNTKTIGLFKFDNITKYQPYGNSNCAIQTNNLSPQEVSFEVLKRII
jgi:ADP-heptose:LPS heptosyltransferase